MNMETNDRLEDFALEEVEARIELGTCITVEICSSPFGFRVCIGAKVCFP
jgi:hypothetical protein